MLAIESTNKGAALAGKDESENNQAMLECLRDSASNVYDEFMSDAVNFQIILCCEMLYVHTCPCKASNNSNQIIIIPGGSQSKIT